MNNIRDLNNLFLYGRSNLIDYNTHQTKKKNQEFNKGKNKYDYTNIKIN